MWGWLGDQVDNFNTKIFPVFTKSHPNISVEYRAFPADGYETQLTTGLAGSNGPDVVTLQAYGILQKHIDAGRLLELDDSVVPGLSKFGTTLLDGARSTKNGNVYGVPFAVQTAGIFYNKKIFADNGITVPTTWDEFTAAADKLKANGVIPLAWNFKDTWETPLYHEIFGAAVYGGDDFTKKFLAGQAKMTDPSYVSSMAVIDSLKPYLPESFSSLSYSDATTLFSSGRAAMVPDGVWNVTSFREVNSELDLGFFPAPPGPDAALDHPVVTSYVDGSFGVNVASTHRDASVELIRWMATPEFGGLFSKVLGQISAVPGVEPSDPVVKQTLDASKQYPHTYLCYAFLNGGTPPCDQLVSQGIQQMLLGKSTPAQVAASVQRGLDQWFKPKN